MRPFRRLSSSMPAAIHGCSTGLGYGHTERGEVPSPLADAEFACHTHPVVGSARMRRSMNKLAAGWVVAALWISGTSLCTAADVRLNPERWFNWRFPVLGGADFTRCDVNPAIATDWDLILHHIGLALARTTPTPADSLFGKVYGQFEAPADQSAPCKGYPLTGMIHFEFLPADIVERVPVPDQPGTTRLKSKGVGKSTSLWVNEFRALEVPDWLKQDGTGQNPSAEMGILRQTGTLKGFPIFNNSVLVVTPAGHVAPYVAAPYDKVVQLSLIQAQRQLDVFSGPGMGAGSSDFDDQIKYLKDQMNLAKAKLSKMTPARRAGPVYWKPSALSAAGLIGDDLTEEPVDGALQIMRANPQYLDTKLPRATAQLLEVSVSSLGLDTPRQAASNDPNDALRGLIESADWARISKLLR